MVNLARISQIACDPNRENLSNSAYSLGIKGTFHQIDEIMEALINAKKSNINYYKKECGNYNFILLNRDGRCTYQTSKDDLTGFVDWIRDNFADDNKFFNASQFIYYPEPINLFKAT